MNSRTRSAVHAGVMASLFASAPAGAWSIDPAGAIGPARESAAHPASACDLPTVRLPGGPGTADVAAAAGSIDDAGAMRRLDLQYRDRRLDEARALELCG